MGYANGTLGTPESNIAFTGTLDLYGSFVGDVNGGVAFYQVLAGAWTGSNFSGAPASGPNPARGGSPPSVYAPQSPTLVDSVTILRHGGKLDQVPVVLGPCTFKGQSDLYMTRAQRQNAPAAVTAQIGTFATLNPGDILIGWGAPELILIVESANLISPATTGGVTLNVNPFDINGNSLTRLPTVPPFEFGPALTMMIDTSYQPTTAKIDWSKSNVYDANGNVVLPSASTTTACPGYQIPTATGYVLLHVDVVDDPGHLCEYWIVTQYGADTTATGTLPSDRDYAQAPSSFLAAASPPPYGVDPGYGTPDANPSPPPAASAPPFPAAAATNWSFVGGGDTIYIPISVSCCYDFQLWLFKRVTDGISYPPAWQYNAWFQTVNIAVTAS
jgi:hypothetical protein